MLTNNIQLQLMNFQINFFLKRMSLISKINLIKMNLNDNNNNYEYDKIYLVICDLCFPEFMYNDVLTNQLIFNGNKKFKFQNICKVLTNNCTVFNLN